MIKGKVVQDIGYRLFLYESAEAMDIPVFQARNIEGVWKFSLVARTLALTNLE